MGGLFGTPLPTLKLDVINGRSLILYYAEDLYSMTQNKFSIISELPLSSIDMIKTRQFSLSILFEGFIMAFSASKIENKGHVF